MNTNTILNIWDDCVNKDQIYRGVALASLALKENDTANLMEWSIEKRDTALFHIRKALFGTKFNNITHCPNCAQTMEWELSLPDLEIPILDGMPDNLKISIDTTDYNLFVRLPNSNDLLANDEMRIIENCILNPDDFPDQNIDKKLPELVQPINDQYDKNCHASNITYKLKCIDCSHEWQGVFDILTYLWKEIDQWAKSFLNQIYLLARTFGWSETEIINMSENRRNHYLNLINS